MTLDASKLMQARVVQVHTWNRVEFDVELGFGVRCSRVFTLEDLPTPSAANARHAVHAMVVLIGGKRVLVQPESNRTDARSARVYLTERIHGHPVGFVSDAPGLPSPVLDVGMFVAWLAARDYDIGAVKAAINGRRREERPEGVG